MKWFWSYALCFNNFVSKDCKGRPLKYYRLPRGIKVIYVRLTGVLGKEKLLMIFLIFQFLQTNYRKSRKSMKPQKMCWKNIKLHHKNYILDSYKNAKRKLEIASQMSKDSQNLVQRTPAIRKRTLVPPPTKKTSSK